MAGDPLWINAATGAPSYTANELRQAMALPLQYDSRAMGGRQGIRPGGDQLLTTLVSTTITVKAGLAVIDPALTSTQGPYWVALPTDETHTLTAPDATNPRKDITILRVYDHDEDSSGLRTARSEYLVGTPNPSPVEPSVPAGAIRLATIDVPASGGGSAVVTDRRVSYLAGPEIVVFTSSGSFTKASYPWARRVRVRAVGGGGGGGGVSATAAGQAAEGAGGGGGGYAEKWVDVWSLPDSVTVTIGAGGTATAGAGGGNGGNTTFGSVCTANGGVGGGNGAATSGDAVVNGGTGGAVTGGDVNIVGGDGGTGRVLSVAQLFMNYGGVSALSGMKRSPASASTAGSAGNAYGGGGSGARNGASQVSRAGGVGAAGVVIVELY